SEGCRGIAIDHNLIAGNVARLYVDVEGIFEIIAGVGCAQFQRLEVRWNELFVFAEHFTDELPHDFEVDIQQDGKGAYVDDILKELLVTRDLVVVHAQLHHRDADVANVLPDEIGMKPFRVVVNKVTSRSNGRDIPGIGLRVNAHDEIDCFAAADVSSIVDPDLKPCRKPLYVRGKNILRGYGDTHSKDRPCKQFVRTGRSSTVHIGKADDHVVHPARMYHIILVVLVTLYKNFFMSHADVGQRSAHSPQ